jgi:hypothetical protein
MRQISGRPHIAYFWSESSNLSLSRFTAETWAIPKPASDTESVGKSKPCHINHDVHGCSSVDRDAAKISSGTATVAAAAAAALAIAPQSIEWHRQQRPRQPLPDLGAVEAPHDDHLRSSTTCTQPPHTQQLSVPGNRLGSDLIGRS